MNILVLNAGSSSQKICLYRIDEGKPMPEEAPAPLWQAQTDESTPGIEGLSSLLRFAWEGPKAAIAGSGEIHAVGHRVVHGGAEFRESVRITADVKAAIQRLVPLAPAHNPAALAGIETAERLLGPDVPQFAVFDTAFHRTLPDAAAIYPGPYEWIDQGIRRYGFHGINHQYVAGRAAHLLGRDLKSLRLISCHLGNGCSLAAIKDGKSIDTTMGFTPLEGLMMGTRSGTVDPGILLYLMRQNGSSAESLDHTLNNDSGLKGISGISGDMRDVVAARARGEQRACLAFDIYIHRLAAEIASMLPPLGGLDALIFTAGVGEHSAEVRSAVCERLSFLGLSLDAGNNSASLLTERNIASSDSPIEILVIDAEEDWSIARDCAGLLLSASTG